MRRIITICRRIRSAASVGLFFGLLWMLSCCLAGSACADAVPYFEKIGPGSVVNPAYGVRVNEVVPDSPAEKAGMKVEDVIVGLDGLRVRDIREFQMVRFASDEPIAGVSVVRAGQLLQLGLSDMLPGGRLGVVIAETKPDFVKLLSSFGIKLRDVLCVKPAPAPAKQAAEEAPKTGLDELMDAFKLEDFAPVAPHVLLAFNRFPARAQEEIAALAGQNDPAAREHVAMLLKVFDLLRHEKYDEAKKLLADRGLAELKTPPFLARLRDFYRALCARPITAQNGFSLAAYGVDSHFFALCYPYPCFEIENSLSFAASDPDFEMLLNKALSGDAQAGSDASDRAYAYANSGDGAAETYIGQIKAALLDPDRHGGWPFRSSIVYDKARRDKTVGELRKLKESDPTRTLEISLALICPAIMDRDTALFKEAYEPATRAGAAVLACANALVENCLSFHRISDPSFYAVCAEVESRIRKPFFYEHLQGASPLFLRRMKQGLFRRAAGSIDEPAGYCLNRPVLVARSLQQPYDEKRIDSALAAMAAKTKPEEILKALRALTFDLVVDPQPARIQTVLRLEDGLGAGGLLDFISRVLAAQLGIGMETPFSGDHAAFCRSCESFMDEVEASRYESAFAAVRQWGKNDAGVPAKAAELFRAAGVPSVCLLISGALRDLGHSAEARRYLGKATSFYEDFVPAYGENAFMRACRDFGAVPGFEQIAEQYMGRYLAPDSSTRCLMSAIMSLHASDIERAVNSMLVVAARNNPPSRVTYVADGKFFRTRADLELYVMGKLLDDKRLTAEQRSKLAATPLYMAVLKSSGKMEARIAELDKAIAEKPTEGALREMLALMSGMKKQEAKAAEYLGKLAAINPSKDNFKQYIDMLSRARNYHAQIDAYVEYFRRYPETEGEVVQNWRGPMLNFQFLLDAYRADKQVDKAIALAEEKLRMYERLSLRLQLAKFYREARKNQEALAALAEMKKSREEPDAMTQDEMVKETALNYEAMGQHSVALGCLLAGRDGLKTRGTANWVAQKIKDLEKKVEKAKK